MLGLKQGGRSCQPFGEGKNGHLSFRQGRICYFRDKCVDFARSCKYAICSRFSSESKLFGEGPLCLHTTSATLG